MTATRDPDRLLRAWLDLMPSEAPDRAIAAVLQAAETTRQVRALPRIGRWRFPMNRLTLIASVALVVAALVGGAYLLAGGRNGPALPTPTPTAAGTPTITTEPVAQFPGALRGLWVAEAEPITGLPNQGSRITALFNWDGGRDFSVGTNFILGSTVLASDALASSPGQFRLRTRDQADGCAPGDVGTYQWQRSADGLFLTVAIIGDPCTIRATTLARTWVRTLGVANDGRTGMAAMSDPYPDVQVTLPSHSWAMDVLPPIDIHTYADGDPGRDFILYVNPEGYEKPCTVPGSGAYVLDRTTDALAAYLRGLSGMADTKSEPATIDGLPATHITGVTGGCPDGDVWLLTQLGFPGSNGGTGEVHVPADTALSIWATVHEGDLVVFWYAGDNIPAAEEQAVIDSIRFTNGLPTP